MNEKLTQSEIRKGTPPENNIDDSIPQVTVQIHNILSRDKEYYIKYLQTQEGLNDLKRGGITIIKHNNEITSIDLRNMRSKSFHISGIDSDIVLQLLAGTKEISTKSSNRTNILFDFFRQYMGIEPKKIITKKSITFDYLNTKEGFNEFLSRTKIKINTSPEGVSIDLSNLTISGDYINGYNPYTFIGHMAGLCERVKGVDEAKEELSKYFIEKYGLIQKQIILTTDTNQPFIDFIKTEKGLDLFCKRTGLIIKKDEKGNIINIDYLGLQKIIHKKIDISGIESNITNENGEISLQLFIKLICRHKTNRTLAIIDISNLLKNFFRDHYGYGNGSLVKIKL